MERLFKDNNILKRLLPFVLIFILASVLYGHSLNSPLVYDDTSLLEGNVHIKSLSSIPYFFKHNFWAPFYDKVISGKGYKLIYRPITNTSFALNFFFSRDNSFDYRVVNLFLHSLNALLVYLFLFRFFKERMLGLFASIFFLIHPLNVESVVLITGRAGLLSTAFLLFGLIFYSESQKVEIDIERSYLYIGSCLFFILALLSKETAIVLPLILILYDFFKKGLRLKTFLWIFYDYLAFWIIIFFYIFLRFLVLGNFLSGSSYIENSPLITFYTMLKTLFIYIKRLFVPIDLSLIYPDPTSRSIFEIPVIASLLLLISIAIFFILSYKKEPLICFALGWFFISLLPVSNIVPAGAAMADRWLYTPLIGFSIFLGEIVKKIKRFRQVAFCSLILFYSFLTFYRGLDWQDPVRLWSKATEVYPSEFRSLVNLGAALEQKGLLNDAEKVYKKALDLEDIDFQERAKVYHNLGGIYERLEEIDRAEEFYRLSLRINPKLALPHLSLGMLMERKGEESKAIEEYKEAVELDPYLVYAYFRLGILYARDRNPVAIEYFTKAIKVRPDYAAAHQNLAACYILSKPQRPELARYHLKKAKHFMKDKAILIKIVELERLIKNFNE